jgi:hypothetical protein
MPTYLFEDLVILIAGCPKDELKRIYEVVKKERELYKKTEYIKLIIAFSNRRIELSLK